MKFLDEALAKQKLYRFGFALYSRDLSVDDSSIDGWGSIALNDFTLRLHPEANFLLQHFQEGIAAVVGHVFVSNGDRSVEQCLRDLVNKNDWSVVEALSGRYALIVMRQGESPYIHHDPFGSSTIYYCADRCCVASHTALVADLLTIDPDPRSQAFVRSSEYKQRGTTYMPGDKTLYPNIYALIPNNRLILGLQKTVRYWPTRPIEQNGYEDFIAAADQYFKRFTEYLDGRLIPLLGLTGGVDSRAVIAALKAHGLAFRLVTWTRLPQAEVQVVEAMKKHLGLPHKWLDTTKIEEGPVFKTYRQLANYGSGLTRGAVALTAQMADGATRSDVFIRGLGGEILRGFYNRHGSKVGGDLRHDFVRLYLTKKVINPSDGFAEYVREAFDGYWVRANCDQNWFDFDPLDLYYWEQRMGVWAASLLPECDPAMYNMVGMNCRALYQRAFGLPRERRLGSQLLVDMTAQYDEKYASYRVES